MKNKLKLLLISLCLLIVLSACGAFSVKIDDLSDLEVSSEIIEVIKPGENELIEVIIGERNIDDFFSNLEFEEWKLKKIPEDAEEGTIYKFYDRETAKFFESVKDKDLYESGTLIVYADEPFIKFKTKYFSVSLSIPEEDHERLLK